MNDRFHCLAIVVGSLVVSPLIALSVKSQTPDFFTAPITTELQRSVAATEASAYAVVNCNSLISQDKPDFAAFSEAQFVEQLQKLAALDPTELRLDLRYHPPLDVSASNKAAIKAKLDNMCRGTGFQKIRVSETFSSAKWGDFIGVLHLTEDAEGIVENAWEDELIRAFPVRTKLSKLLVGDAACLIQIHRTFDGRQTSLSVALIASIKQSVQSMELVPGKGKLMFEMTSTSAGGDLVEKLFSNRQPAKIPPGVTSPAILALLTAEIKKFKPSPAMSIAWELGFESVSYRHTPCGGAPEQLIGKPAPNFTLETLSGERMELQSFIQDRPALISFWGVACAPCCREAPYLTKLNEKIASQGFAIVAVNAYDESRETVSKFVEQAKLNHTIVLDGRSVARDLYFVGAYPTSFFVNRDGTIEDYDIGFASAAALETHALKLLK